MKAKQLLQAGQAALLDGDRLVIVTQPVPPVPDHAVPGTYDVVSFNVEGKAGEGRGWRMPASRLTPLSPALTSFVVGLNAARFGGRRHRGLSAYRLFGIAISSRMRFNVDDFSLIDRLFSFRSGSGCHLDVYDEGHYAQAVGCRNLSACQSFEALVRPPMFWTGHNDKKPRRLYVGATVGISVPTLAGWFEVTSFGMHNDERVVRMKQRSAERRMLRATQAQLDAWRDAMAAEMAEKAGPAPAAEGGDEDQDR